MLNNIKMVVTLLVITICVMIYAINLYKKYKKQGKEAALSSLRETAYKLFMAKEEKFGPKKGIDKMAEAVTDFYKLVAPDMIEKLIPGETVESFLQKTFDDGYKTFKDFLDDGQINNSTAVQQ